MADTTEKKTYLVNVESNLNEYIIEAAKAKEEVDKLTASNKELKASGDATTEEIEASNAALRNAQKEYGQAKKLVDLQTQANNSNAESRKQLAAIVAIEQQKLGALANQYVINEKGQRVLSKAYLDQVSKLKNAKDAIIAYDKAQSDGRSSIGLYSEAIDGALGKFQMMPGALGSASAGVAKLNTVFKLLAANPIGLVITAIVTALTLLVKAFKGNDEASEKFAGIMKGIGVAIKEVLGRIVSLGQAVGKLFKGEFKEAAALAKEAVSGFADSLKEAYAAGTKQQLLLNEIEDKEIELLEIRAKREKEIAELKIKARDADEGSLKQTELLRKAQALINANLKDDLALQRKRVELAQLELDSTNKNQVTDEMRKKVAEERAKLYEMETQALNEQGGLIRRINTLENQGVKEQEARVKAMEKAKEALLKEITDHKKWLADRKVAEAEALKDKTDKEKEAKLKQEEWEKERQLINAENNLQILEFNLTEEFSRRRARLMLMEKQELDFAEKTGANVYLIKRKYQLAQNELERQERDAKLSIYADFASSLATLFGQNTAIGRVAAVTATIINTYRGAMAAFAETPGDVIIKSLAAATAVAAGIASVKKIMSTKSGLPGDSGGGSAPAAPTAITSNIPMERSFATNTGSSILTQTQLSQQQLNSMPSQNMLTAEDIANALQKMPPPVVTVEDINAKSKSVRKVEVRANI